MVTKQLKLLRHQFELMDDEQTKIIGLVAGYYGIISLAERPNRSVYLLGRYNMTAINGHEAYLISKDGKIYSTKTKKFMTHCNDQEGYKIIKLDRKMFKVHRLLALTFIPNPQNKPQVNHINGIKYDNRIDNLEWATSSENVKHAIRTGLYSMDVMQACNEKNKRFNEDEITYIRSSFRKTETTTTLSKKFNVSSGVIHQILHHITYKECRSHGYNQAT